MTISTINDIVTGLTAAQRSNTYKTMGTTKGASYFQSSWLATGWPVAGSASPAYTAGSGYTCDRTTTGAMPYSNAVTQNWLAKWQAYSTQVGTLYLYDRLWSCSNMGYAASTYTVTTPGSLPARIADNGVGCECWIENFVAAGASTGNFTINYKNPAGSDEQGVLLSANLVNGPVAGQMQPVPLQSGSTGIKQLVSCVNASTWSSGSWGMTICKFVAAISMPVINTAYFLDWASIALPPIPQDACLFWIWQSNTSTAATIFSNTAIIDK